MIQKSVLLTVSSVVLWSANSVWALEPASSSFMELVKKRNATSEPAPVRPPPKKAEPSTPSGKEGVAKIRIKVEGDCYDVEFASAPGEVLSCKDPLSLEYKRRKCGTSQKLESATAEAIPSCDDKKRIGLRFRTSQGVVAADLRVQREADGRSGYVTKYFVESSRYETSALQGLLPDPVQRIEEAPPEESPLVFKFSGFAWVEGESSRRFGYDAGSSTQTAQPNFTAATGSPSQSNFNFFSNLNFEIAKDRTRLVSILEIGETFFGDSSTGGAVGARSSSLLEVRNLYLVQQVSEPIEARAGLITTASDPRSFIFNDHIASVQGAWKSDRLEAFLWYGSAAANRVGASRSLDRYLGFSSGLPVAGSSKVSLFGLYRAKANEEFAFDDGTGTGTFTTASGDVGTYWAGATADAPEIGPLSAQGTVIGSWTRAKVGAANTDTLSAYLADAKLTYNWEAPQLKFTLEGLGTSGAKGVVESTTGKPVFGKRKGFPSPVGASYLLTVATSDGVDDAPGSPKQSILGSLSQDEGLRIGVFTVSANVTKRMTCFGRVAKLATAEGSTTTTSTDYGEELDAGAVYQLTPSATFQLDYGRFKPGNFFAEKQAADLFAAKIKYSF